jgi:hypothetical protein
VAHRFDFSDGKMMEKRRVSGLLLIIMGAGLILTEFVPNQIISYTITLDLNLTGESFAAVAIIAVKPHL